MRSSDEGLYSATALSYANAGGSVWVKIAGMGDRRVVAGNNINSANLTVAIDGEGKGIAYTEHGDRTILQRTGRFIKVRPESLAMPSVSWVRVWVTHLYLFIDGSYPHVNNTQTAYFQVKGKPKIPLLSSFVSSFPFGNEIAGSGSEGNLLIEILNVSVVDVNTIFVELKLFRSTFGTAQTITNSCLRYVIKNGESVTQLASHAYAYTAFNLSTPPRPSLPTPLPGYDDYINRDPFGATQFGSSEPEFPPSLQIYPSPKRYDAYFGKKFFFNEIYAPPPSGLARRINEFTETVQGIEGSAKYYIWAIALTPSKVEEYIRRSTGDRPYWEEVLRQGSKLPAPLGGLVRTGSEARAITPLTGILEDNLLRLAKQQDSAILEVYEIDPFISSSYISNNPALPFYSIPELAKKIGETAIDFNDSAFRYEFGLSEQESGGIRFIDFFVTRQILIKAIV